MPFRQSTRWWIVSLSITAWISFRYLPTILRESEDWLDLLTILVFPVLVWWLVTLCLGLIVFILRRDDDNSN